MRQTWRVLLESGPVGLLKTINAGIHDLASEGARNPIDIWLHLGRIEYRQRWIRRFDRLSRQDVREIARATARLAHQPLLSVLMPVYNSDERWLRAAIRSVQNQIYSNWELCIADDHSSDPRVATVLREIASSDRRLKLHFRAVNGHISAASNSALSLASGEFIVLLDHDDVLPLHALAAVVHELNRHPDADIVYSDEDRLDQRGRRYDPYFKPDWNPELFLGQNLISHLGVYRTALVRQVGGFREGLEGSQDYDMALRVIEQSHPDRIRHIPLVLYHWRAIPGSAALGVEQKAIEQQLTDHLGDLPEYRTVNMAEQADHAARLLSENPDLARRVALGEVDAPHGLLPESVFVAVENKAIAEGDVATIRDLASGKLTEQATTMGQRIRALAERDPDSPVGAIQRIADVRGKSIEPKAIKDAMAELRAHIDEATAIPHDAFQAFIDSLRC